MLAERLFPLAPYICGRRWVVEIYFYAVCCLPLPSDDRYPLGQLLLTRSLNNITVGDSIQLETEASLSSATLCSKLLTPSNISTSGLGSAMAFATLMICVSRRAKSGYSRIYGLLSVHRPRENARPQDSMQLLPHIFARVLQHSKFALLDYSVVQDHLLDGRHKSRCNLWNQAA